MSYRTYVNDVQIFGNNVYDEKWIAYLEKNHIIPDEDGCYEGELLDFMEAMDVIERIALSVHEDQVNQQKRLIKTKRRILERTGTAISFNQYADTMANIRKIVNTPFDLTVIPERMEKLKNMDMSCKDSLFDELLLTIKENPAFMPVMFYEACKEDLEPEEWYKIPGHAHCYRLKPGKTIRVRAS